MKKKHFIIIDFEFLASLSECVGRDFNLTECVIISYIRSFGKKGYYGSQKTFAEKIFISDRTLRNHLAKLLKEGIIVEKKNDGFDTKRLCINENKNITIYKSDKNIFDMFFEDEN
jgi:DNA-binding MarR family transcriptional regulator